MLAVPTESSAGNITRRRCNEYPPRAARSCLHRRADKAAASKVPVLHRLRSVGNLHRQSAAHTNVEFQQPLAGRYLFALTVKQAIDRQNEQIAVETIEFVAAVAVRTIDPQTVPSVL